MVLSCYEIFSNELNKMRIFGSCRGSQASPVGAATRREANRADSAVIQADVALVAERGFMSLAVFVFFADQRSLTTAYAGTALVAHPPKHDELELSFGEPIIRILIVVMNVIEYSLASTSMASTRWHLLGLRLKPSNHQGSLT